MPRRARFLAILSASSLACGLSEEERWRLGKGCCDCVAGVWSSRAECTLVESQAASYRACAAGSGLEERIRLTERVFRDPFGELERPADELRATASVCRALLAMDVPQSAVVRASLGLHHYYAGDLVEAEEVLSPLVDNPELWEQPMRAHEVLEHLGLVYIAWDRFELAEEILKRNVQDWEQQPLDMAYYRGCPFQRLGHLYQRMGEPQRAVPWDRQAAEIELRQPVESLARAMELFTRGERARAKVLASGLEGRFRSMGSPSPDATGDILQRAALSARVARHAKVLLGHIALLDEETQEAEALYREVLVDEADPGALAGLGHVALARGDLSAATSQLQRALTLSADPEDAYGELSQQLALLGMAWQHQLREDPDGALPFYDAVLEREPELVLALVGKASALVSLGRLPEALAQVERALEVDPDSPGALAEAGVIRLDMAQPDQAEALFLRAIEAGGDGHTCPYEGLGLVYLQRGQPDKARASFERAIALDPDREHRKYTGLARILLDEGELERAEDLLQRALANCPGDPEAQQLLQRLRVEP